MTEEKKQTTGPETLYNSWMKATADFWGSAARTWSTRPGGFPAAPDKEAAQVKDLWLSLYEMWQTFFSVVSKGDDPDSRRPATLLPELIMKAAQPLWAGYFLLHKQWQEGISALRGNGPESLGEMARNMSRAWFDLYEKEFQQILNLPQLGLTRFYQERVNRIIEKFTKFQSELTEFLHILYDPLEKVFQALQEDVDTLSKRGEDFIEDSRAYYQIWIRKLEEHYSNLLRSPEYLQSLGSTLKALQDFRKSREQFLIDVIQDLPVATNREMDELYRDLYVLKKRVKALEKRVKP